MNTMKWLIQREYWENKGMVFWAPAIVGTLMIAFTVIMLIAGNNIETHLDGDKMARLSELTMQERGALTGGAAAAFPMVAMPLYVMMAFLIFFYCLNALYDDRRDRSILFWKSLPVSDTLTVLSKAGMAMVAVPVIVAVISFVTSLTMLLLGTLFMAFKGVNLFGELLASPAFWLSPFRMLSLVPVYLLWALPTVGWLLMVSSWARSKVFLWAVGAPLLSGALLAWANHAFKLGLQIEWYFQNVVLRLLGSVLPGAWFLFNESSRQAMEHVDDRSNPGAAVGQFYNEAYASLASPTLWVGVAAGVAMIAAAIWLRRWREEN